MKLERLNENQIRCTLSKTDLEQRQLRLSELAYGSVKARELFRDMIQQASVELGFEAENIPLMIEAIPISNDCLILVVTKVEDPEELDTRFSRFSKLSDTSGESDYQLPYYDDDDDFQTDGTYSRDESGDLSPADFSDLPEDMEDLDPLGLIAPFTKALAEARRQAERKQKAQEEHRESGSHSRLFTFENLDQIITLASFLTPFFNGESSLYKDSSTDEYYLFLHRNDSSPEIFRRACLIASDYGSRTPVSYASRAYCMEHCQLLFEGDALAVLNQLN